MITYSRRMRWEIMWHAWVTWELHTQFSSESSRIGSFLDLSANEKAVEHSPTWEANSRSDSQDILRLVSSTPQYAFMAWCSVKAQGQLYLYLLPFVLHLIWVPKFHTVVTRARHLSLSWARWIQSTPLLYVLHVSPSSSSLIRSP
jgi:hypothetical protein